MDELRITEHLPVTTADGERLGTVDHMDGGAIKLTKTGSPDGKHHWIPVAWVTSVDSRQVQLSRDATQARREWMDEAPGGTG